MAVIMISARALIADVCSIQGRLCPSPVVVSVLHMLLRYSYVELPLD